VRAPIPSWFRDDPLTATLVYLLIIAALVLGVVIIVKT
jgi:hypothetical protein